MRALSCLSLASQPGCCQSCLSDELQSSQMSYLWLHCARSQPSLSPGQSCVLYPAGKGPSQAYFCSYQSHLGTGIYLLDWVGLGRQQEAEGQRCQQFGSEQRDITGKICPYTRDTQQRRGQRYYGLSPGPHICRDHTAAQGL